MSMLQETTTNTAEQVPAFARALEKQLNEQTQVPAGEYKDPLEIAFKTMMNRVTSAVDVRLEGTNTLFLVDLSPIKTTVDLDKLEKVILCFVERLVALGNASTIIIGSRARYEIATISVSGFLDGSEGEVPRKISPKHVNKAVDAGLGISMRSKAGEKVIYDIKLWG